MPLTRLDNLISSKTGKYLYVSPDDFNASDALDNRGNSPLRPFVSIQRAFLEAARFSYLPDVDNDRFDQFTIMLAPGNHYIDNRPGIEDVSSLPVFQFNQTTQEWEANTNVSFDLSEPDNILYKFNGRDGGATIPRGTSLVGTDLRRTQVRALYVPDPADKDVPRTSLFNVTGGCYFWQFTILDGDLESSSPLFDSSAGVGKVYTQPNDNTNLAVPEFSHHKMTNFVFADKEDLGLLYRKIARVFSDYQPSIDDVYVEGSNAPVTTSWVNTVTYEIGDRVLYDGNAYIASVSSTNIEPDSDETKWSRLVIRGREFDYRIQENRIVGPLQDAIRIDSLKIEDSNPAGIVTVTARTKINHSLFPGQYVAVTNNGLNVNLNGVFKVSTISQTDPKEFTYRVTTTANGLGLISGQTYNVISSPALDTNATIQSEVDSVESASPYVFNVSIRSTWGICGIWADGRKATGFKSMVIAQYTGVSLQKDDRAFIRYDEFTNTWNQAPLTDAFATTPYHIKGDAYWKDDWRNFHVRASDDSFIQNVSIFAVGFADHFLLESGGDMSITNSNSNFGNTSMHSVGYKGFAFNQDKGGYITDIIPPRLLSALNVSKQQYYSIDAQLTRSDTNNPSTSLSKLYISSEDAKNPENRPAASISGYRLGAKRNEKIFVKLDTTGAKSAELNPSGFKKWTARLITLTPSSARSTEDATTLYVASTAGISVGNYVRVDDEYFLVNSVTPTSLAVSRSQLNSLPAEHANSAAVIKYVQNTTVSTVVSETIDATETVFTLTSNAGFFVNGFVEISNSQTSITEIVRVVSIEPNNEIVVQRGALGTTAVSQPIGSTVTATFLSNTYSPASPLVSTILTEVYPRTIVATNTTSETEYNLNQDAANLIDSNKAFIQSETFGYILEKYPYLQNISYVNPNITSETGRYRDGSILIRANRQEIIDYAFSQMQTAFPAFTVPDSAKCERDIGYIVDAIADDLYNGGNSHIIAATKAYFDNNGALISNGVSGEQVESIFAFNRARDWAKKAISNLLTSTSLLDIASITSSGTTVTVTTNVPHNLTDGTEITVGGATQSQYNGAFTVLSSGLTSTQFRYTVSAAPTVSPATGAYYISTIVIDPLNDDPGVGRFYDSYNLININRQEIIDNAYAEIAIQHPTFTNPNPVKCKRDIGYIVDSVAQDLFWGGNEFTVGAVREYFNLAGVPISNGLVGEVVESVTAFNAARDEVKKAITNQLTNTNLSISEGESEYGDGNGVVSNTDPTSCADVQTTVDNLFAIVTDVITAGTLNNLPLVDNGEYDCANVRNTIDTLTAILTDSLASGSIINLPVADPGQWSQVSEASKCKRDIGYIIEAVTSDLRLGGNENTINAAEAYYTAVPSGYSLDYIENERTETIDAYNYARNLAISAMRNHNTYINNASTTSGSPVVTVASTIGLSIGMRVRSVDAIPTSSTSSINFNTIIPSTAYIKKIGDGTNGLATNQIELGVEGSVFDNGTTVNATSTSSTVKLYVELSKGIWASKVEPVQDTSVIQDYNYLAAGDVSTGSPGGECASVANSLVNYFSVISSILNNGVGTIPRVYSTLNTGSLAQRSTLFTLTENDSNNSPTTNPHNLETGTPVRLVPRAKTGVNVDKRLIRLPKGFDTNTVYYVIAPGRRTDPFDYSNSIGFDGSNQQTLMLATSQENASAGIYIYSSETDNIDGNVEIDVYQYVLDTVYDLHQYQTKVAEGSSIDLETDSPHIFDVPANNVVPQKVFFRVASDIPGSSLPTLSSAFGGTTISSKTEYYVRYLSSKRFRIYETFANARDDISPVTFQPGSTSVFYTFANKKRSPLKFDSTVGTEATIDNGCWYLDTIPSTNQIIPILKTPNLGWESRERTTDTYFERIEDTRTKEDRVYRLRYVIPKNLKTVRDPLRGFVIKVRTDEKRRLLPQKILLRPTASGSSLATVNAPLTGERLGLTTSEQLALNPNFESTYDPSPFGNPKRIETSSKIAFTVQSARKRRIGSSDFLELTVFDVGVDAEAYKTQLFTTVKISAPQGGDGRFVDSIPNIQIGNPTAANKISWSGNSKGTAYVHALLSYGNDYYLIIKDVTGNSEISWDPNVATTFTQGSVTATLLDEPNGGRSDIANFLYVVEGANVYTMTPGDTLNDDNGVSYTIAEVEDVSEMESTFYIFDINTIRRRIPGQQDGVYYLTCLRGDIRPYPTGSGVGENFRNFRFSQPVSKLYPEFYKNDPEWYRGIDPSTATLVDPPPTISAADNYIHGLVTVNDSKGSVTKEMVLDFVADPGTGNYSFSGFNEIKALSGGASAGSEARRISISGDSPYPTENRLYVELRRPSIARSGNHTFEYLGFGPGNYSTGFPARQEIVLTDVQDFYAQAKREDAGIVFYTGLNSNGDLYIGNRKINAITGEETFLERAVLVESEDQSDSIGTLVTTFDTAVTFNDIITVNGDGGDKESFFNSPVVINNATSFGVIENLPSLRIVTGEGTAVGYDSKLENNIAGQRTGDIVIHQNKITSAVFDFNPRGTQDYSFRVALSNRTPDFTNVFGGTTNGPSQLQNTDFGTRDPMKSGDIQLKGDQTLFTGSLGWIYANDYIRIENESTVDVTPQIVGIQGSVSGNVVRLNWNTGLTNTTIGITAGSQVRITGALGSLAVVNGVWRVFSSVSQPFSPSNNFVDILITTNLPVYNVNLNNGKGFPTDQIAQPSINIARSISGFKEVGVIGAEALRTESATIGDYKLGINTVARSAHSAYQTAFVSAETEPRANLDVVGTTFISGKKINSYLSQTGTNKTETAVDNALLVGGNSTTPNNAATLRVMTTNSGRVGVNATNAQLDRSLVVVGNGRITGDFRFESDIEVNGGDITTTNTFFNFVNQSNATTFTGAAFATTANLFNSATANQTINVGQSVTGSQTFNLGNSASTQTLTIGTTASTTTLNLHTASTNSTINIGTVPSSLTNTSNITIGGAFANSAGSRLTIRNANVQLDGDLEVNGGDLKSTAQTFNLFNIPGAVSTLNFARFASTIEIGAVAGSTTIRNSLNVNGNITDFGDFTLKGGLRSAAVFTTRASLGTTAAFHDVGSLSNLNVDFYEYVDNVDGDINIISISSNTINVIDNYFNNNDKIIFTDIANFTGVNNGIEYYVINATSGSFQVSNLPGGSPITLTTTGTVGAKVSLSQTTLDGLGGASINALVTTIAIKNPRGISQFDYLLIDSEILRVLTPPTSTAPYTFTVERGADGTTPASHLDDTLVYKLNKTSQATFVSPGPVLASNLTRNVSSIDAVSNFLTVPGTTGLFNGLRITFSNVGSISGINTTTNAYYISNVSVSGGNQIFQLSTTYPILNIVDIGGTAGAAAFSVNSTFINLAEFGGSFKANDFIKIDDEFLRITSISQSDPQGLFITNGATNNELTVFSVDSTTGNTIIGNPNVSGSLGSGRLTVYDTITFSGNGSTSSDAQRLVITNGTTTETFSVRSADGNTYIGGTLQLANDFSITNGQSGPTFFSVDAQTGNTVIGNGNSGTLKVESNLGSTSISTGALVVDGGAGIAENLYVGGDAFIQGGDLTVSSSGTTRFKVNNTGSLDLGGITNYFTSTGGRKWIWLSTSSSSDATAPVLAANTNYLIRPNGTNVTLILKLPTNAQTGDMIRLVDVGGNLTSNCTLIIRAPGESSPSLGDGVRIQGDATGSRAGGLVANHTGGELIIQTPNAALGLIYAGQTDGIGTTIDTDVRGWWLMEI